MAGGSTHLRLVRNSPVIGGPTVPEPGDLAFIATLFGVNLVPVFGAVLRLGHWDSGTVGLAAVGVVVTGLELKSQVRAVLRARR